jgi:hypothetical protein
MTPTPDNKATTVNGKKTAVGDVVHYTDHNGQRHPAKITALTGTEAHLRVFHAHGETRDHDAESVPHSATAGATHSWMHFPE